MADNIKDKVLEFASIAKECPENLQEKCFELLLSDYLEQQRPVEKKKRIEPDNKDDESEKNKDSEKKKEKDNDNGKQGDILEKDLHVKVKQFMKKSVISIDQINQVFYKENNDIKPLYDDLKTTKASESQIRIALLNALRNAILNGDFKFDGEEVRKEAQVRKCYDAANYVKNFKTSANLFDGFEAYDKASSIISLSTDGKDRLAEIIKDLQ